mmetsp:Transcript_139268/g.445192  ORF Transcript_139268/g.445192 Transcript_139268/m.445192 type:complete len:213 (+) Transcript_139268:2312-2950(+)
MVSPLRAGLAQLLHDLPRHVPGLHVGQAILADFDSLLVVVLREQALVRADAPGHASHRATQASRAQCPAARTAVVTQSPRHELDSCVHRAATTGAVVRLLEPGLRAGEGVGKARAVHGRGEDIAKVQRDQISLGGPLYALPPGVVCTSPARLDGIGRILAGRQRMLCQAPRHGLVWHGAERQATDVAMVRSGSATIDALPATLRRCCRWPFM